MRSSGLLSLVRRAGVLLHTTATVLNAVGGFEQNEVLHKAFPCVCPPGCN